MDKMYYLNFGRTLIHSNYTATTSTATTTTTTRHNYNYHYHYTKALKQYFISSPRNPGLP